MTCYWCRQPTEGDSIFCSKHQTVKSRKGAIASGSPIYKNDTETLRR